MPVLRQTINLSVTGNTLEATDAATGSPVTDAGVQGENGAVLLRCTVPDDWKDLTCRLQVTARSGAFDESEAAQNGVAALPLRAGVTVPGALAVILTGEDVSGNVRKTADCDTLSIRQSTVPVSPIAHFLPLDFEALARSVGNVGSLLTAAKDSLVNAANELFTGKVDKIPGKGLSTVDFTDTGYTHTDCNYTAAEKSKLAGMGEKGGPATTDELPEGSFNHYYTDARADARIALQKGTPGEIAALGPDGGMEPGEMAAAYTAPYETYAASFPIGRTADGTVPVKDGAPVLVYSIKGRTLHQLAGNGNFAAAGTGGVASGWNAAGNGGTYAFAPGTQSVTIPAGGSGIGLTAAVHFLAGHVYFLRCKMKLAHGETDSAALTIDGAYNSGVPEISFLSGSAGQIADSEEKVLNLCATALETLDGLRVAASLSGVGGGTLELYECMVLDLTADFGAGNEPGAGDCSVMDYFDGTLDCLDPSVVCTAGEKSSAIGFPSMTLRGCGDVCDQLDHVGGRWTLTKRIADDGSVLKSPEEADATDYAVGTLTGYSGGTLSVRCYTGYFARATVGYLVDAKVLALQAPVVPVTAKGDLLGFDTAPARVPVGHDGQILVADSTQPLGVRWIDPASYTVPSGAFVRDTTGSSGKSASSAVTISENAQVGDLLVLFSGANYQVTAAPSGWTLLSATNRAYHDAALLVKICTASDIGATVTVPMGGTDCWHLVCCAVGGWTQYVYGDCQETNDYDVTTLSVSPVQFPPFRRGIVLLFGSTRDFGLGLSFTSGSPLFQLLNTGGMSSTLWLMQDVSCAAPNFYYSNEINGKSTAVIGIC